MRVDFPKLSPDWDRSTPIFEQIFDRLFLVFQQLFGQYRQFVDATAGAQVVYLPENPSLDYFVVKTDASANTVTITAFSGHTIEGAGTHVLAAQYDNALLVFNRGTQTWYIQ